MAAPSPISSMPSAASASTSFISESTLPRTTPSLASMRWMVGSERPARCASLALVEAEQRPGGPQLRGGDHADAKRIIAIQNMNYQVYMSIVMCQAS